MYILITGCLGLIGSELVTSLKGHRLFGIDNESHNCVGWGDVPVARWSPKTYCSLDLIIHCASPVGHARLTPEAETAWHIVQDTQLMIEAAKRHNARLITFSSSEVLAYQGETDIRAQYALGKLTSEAMVLGHPAIDARIIRPYNVTGWRQRADGGFVMARFRDQALVGEHLTIFGTGKQERSFLHVSDLAAFVLLLIEKWPERRLWSVLNPANKTTITNLAMRFSSKGVLTEGSDALGNKTWRDTPERPLDLDGYERCRGLGWAPKVTLDEMVVEHLTRRQPTCSIV